MPAPPEHCPLDSPSQHRDRGWDDREAAQIDEHARHAGNHLAIFNNSVEIARIGERFGQVMADLGDTGFDCQRRIPGAAFSGIEAIGSRGLA